MAGRDLCFVVGGPYGLRARARRPPPVARADDAAAPARARRAARAALPRAQDPRRTSPTTTDGDAETPRARASSGLRCGALRSLGARASRCVRRRSATLGVRRSPRTSASGTAFSWSLDTVATVGSHPRRTTVGGRDRQGPADHPRRRYAVLRPGDGDGVLRLGAPRRPSRRAPHARGTIDATSRPLHHLRLRPRGPAGRARPARRGRRATSSSTTTPRAARRRAGVGVRFIEGRGRATTRSCARAGIERARAVVACVDSDAENIFITLTARELQPDIAIVARASRRGLRAQAAPRRAPTA